MWTGPIPMAGRSEKGAESHLVKAVLSRCRAEGHESYRFATFSDIRGEGADPRLAEAWDHFGGSTQQSTFARKTSFKLVFFSRTVVPTGYVSSKMEWLSCWTDRQRKAEEKRLKLEAKRKKRIQKIQNKSKSGGTER